VKWVVPAPALQPDAHLRARDVGVQNIAGTGLVLVVTLLAELLKVDARSRQQVAALFWAAPVTHECGAGVWAVSYMSTVAAILGIPASAHMTSAWSAPVPRSFAETSGYRQTRSDSSSFRCGVEEMWPPSWMGMAGFGEAPLRLSPTPRIAVLACWTSTFLLVRNLPGNSH